MAFLFCDGVDSYSDTADIQFKLPGTTPNIAYAATSGRFGAGAFKCSGNNYSDYLYPPTGWAISASYAINFSFWAKSDTAGIPTNYSGAALMQLVNDSASGKNWNILNTSKVTGKLNVSTNAASPTVTNGNTDVVDANWHWIEVSALITTSSGGYIQVYVDGLLDINYSGATVVGAGYLPSNITIFSIYPTNLTPAGDQAYIDDLIIWDTSGASFNSFPLGPQHIVTLVPDANGSTNQFTASSGANYTCVNGGYDSSSYVYSSTLGQIDLYEYPSMSYAPYNINGVVTNVFAQNSGTGSISLAPKIKTGSATETGSSVALASSTYKLSQNVFPLDANGSAWTESTVNSIQAGISD